MTGHRPPWARISPGGAHEEQVMRYPTRLVQGAMMIALIATSLAGLVTPSAGAPAGPRGAAGDRYIVVLRDDVDPRGAARELGRAYGLDVGHVYDVVLKGFAARVRRRARASTGAVSRDRCVECRRPEALERLS